MLGPGAGTSGSCCVSQGVRVGLDWAGPRCPLSSYWDGDDGLGWVGRPSRPGGRGGTCHRFGNSPPNPPQWEPRVNVPDSALGIQPFIGQHPQRWVRGGVLAGHCCRSHRGWVVVGWLLCGGRFVYICSIDFLYIYIYIYIVNGCSINVR